MPLERTGSKTDTIAMLKEKSDTRELSIIKTLNAPVEMVWEAWTNKDQIVNWWGPAGFTSTIHKMDVKEGEEWLLTLHGPDGKNYPNKSIFREVIPLKKIVYEHFNPDFIATVTFEPTDNQTIIEWSSLFPSVEFFEIVVKTFKADEGMKQNVGKLEDYLSIKTHPASINNNDSPDAPGVKQLT